MLGGIRQKLGRFLWDYTSHWLHPSRSSMCLCPQASSLSPRLNLRLQHTLLLQVWGNTDGQETEARPSS